MNFSIRNLLIVIAIFSLVMGLAYGIGGGIGYAGLVFLSVYVFPPFLWVAALNSAGLKRSFFVGVMVAGTVHFVVNIYLMWMLLVSAAREGVAAFLFF